MRIIKPKKRIQNISYTIFFADREDPSYGFSFECDEHGVVDPSKLHPSSILHFKECLTGENNTIYQGIQKEVQKYTEYAKLQCYCGNIIDLACFTNACECGLDYNINGDLLAPREQWGEETGESWIDIMCISKHNF